MRERSERDTQIRPAVRKVQTSEKEWNSEEILEKPEHTQPVSWRSLRDAQESWGIVGRSEGTSKVASMSTKLCKVPVLEGPSECMGSSKVAGRRNHHLSKVTDNSSGGCEH